MTKNLKRYLTNNYAFAAACLVVLWLSYVLAFNKTVQAYQLHRQLNEQANQAADVSYPAAFQLRKQANLQKVIKSYSSDTTRFRMQVMGALAALAEQHHCRVVAVPADKTGAFTSGHLQVQKVTLEGRFADLVRLLRQAEGSPSGGWVQSAVWQSKEERSATGQVQHQLYLSLYLSNIDNK